MGGRVLLPRSFASVFAFAFASALGLSSSVGCGDDDRPPTPGTDAGPLPDGGRRDGGGGADGGPLVDGALPDGFVPPIDGGTFACAPGAAFDLYTNPMLEIGRLDVAVGTGEDGFLVGWTARRTGEDGLRVRHIGVTGEPSDVIDVSMITGVQSSSPALAGLGSGWLALWSDNRFSNDELAARVLGSGGALGAALTRVTDNAIGDRSATIIQTGDGYLLLHTEDDLMTTRAVRTLFDPAGAVTSAPAPIAGMSGITGRVALSSLDDGVAAVWVDTTTARVLKLLPMDRDGTPRGDAITLSDATVGAEIDVWGTLLGGAVVYEVSVGGARDEVRFRAIDETGMPATAERGLSEIGGQGRAPSVDYLGGNYAVAYRARTREGAEVVQLLLVDSVGNELSRVDVAPIEDWNGRVFVRFSPAGQGLVVWTDRAGTALSIRAARLTCEVTG